MDWKYIKNVHKQFGEVALRTFPHLNIFQYTYYHYKQKWINMLDYLDFNKSEAKNFLKTKLFWKDYGWKHHESIYTRFYQGYILPKKFGFDKRKMHYSSLICSGEMSRDAALNELTNEPYPIEMQEEDKMYFIKKFDLTEAKFEEIMSLPKRSYWDYPCYGTIFESNIYKGARAIYRVLAKK